MTEMATRIEDLPVPNAPTTQVPPPAQDAPLLPENPDVQATIQKKEPGTIDKLKALLFNKDNALLLVLYLGVTLLLKDGTLSGLPTVGAYLTSEMSFHIVRALVLVLGFVLVKALM
jgi:hypothetical protein